MNLTDRNKVYFASDFHLGAPAYNESRVREAKIVNWMDQIKNDAVAIYFLGDIFDFWFEYKTVVPKGFVRLLGKFAELSDQGIELHLITGNHDLWMHNYFKKELGVKVYFHPTEIELNGKKFYLAHGDGLGPGEILFKGIKKVFTNSLAQWFFSKIHPDLGIKFANFWSFKSRKANNSKNKSFKGDEKEYSIIHAKKTLTEKHYDFLIYGHRHIPLDIKLNDNSRYLNLGDWISHYSFAVFDGERLELKYFKQE